MRAVEKVLSSAEKNWDEISLLQNGTPACNTQDPQSILLFLR